MSSENTWSTEDHLARRVDRLPKWVRDHINSLKREVARANQEVKEVRLETEDPSDVMFVRATYARQPVPLTKGSRVIFRTPKGEIRVYWHDVTESVVVTGYADLGESFIVQPEVSNGIRVRLAEMP